MVDEVKKIIKKRGYATMSEYVRDILRDSIYPRLTENGLAPAIESDILQSASEPVENDIVLDTDEEVRNYFTKLNHPKNRRKHSV